MAKTATLNLRVDPESKAAAEDILNRLGLSMSTAMDMFLKQIVLTGGLPFPVQLPSAPAPVNADLMTEGELTSKLERSVEAARKGQVRRAAEAFAEHRANSGTKLSDEEIAMIEAARNLPESFDEDNPPIDPVATPEQYNALMQAVAERNRKVAKSRREPE